MVFLLLKGLSYIAGGSAFIFCTLSLASGLLYIAEIIEEHSRIAKTIGKRAIYAIILIHVLLCLFDHLPWHLCLFGIIAQGIYLTNFSRSWPFISLTSLQFVGSCLVVLANHFLWFFYFSERAKTAEHHFSRHRSTYRPAWDTSARSKAHEPLSFMDVATFFGVCVWLVPFYLFLSLSANDNVLPSQSLNQSTGASAKMTPSNSSSNFNNLTLKPSASNDLANGRRSSIMKTLIAPVINFIPAIPSKSRSSRSQRDGIIASPRPSAPPTPAVGSPSSFNFWGQDNPTAFPSPHLSPQPLSGRSTFSTSPIIGMGRPPPKRSATTGIFPEDNSRSMTPPPFVENLRASQGADNMVRRVVSSASLLLHQDEDSIMDSPTRSPIRLSAKAD